MRSEELLGDDSQVPPIRDLNWETPGRKFTVSQLPFLKEKIFIRDVSEKDFSSPSITISQHFYVAQVYRSLIGKT